MSYTDVMGKLADRVGGQLEAAYTRWQAAEITDEQFAAIVAAYLTVADAHATTLADLALAAYLTARLRRATPALGLPAPGYDHKARIGELMTAGALAEQWASYGRGSTLATAQRTYQQAMQGQGVERWTRVPNAGACPVCRDLAGTDLPTDVPMWHHPGCGCTQKPVIR